MEVHRQGDLDIQKLKMKRVKNNIGKKSEDQEQAKDRN